MPPSPDRLVGLASHTRPTSLARTHLLPLPGELWPLFGEPGIQRGAVLAITNAVPARANPCTYGASSLATWVVSKISPTGAWCAVVNFPEFSPQLAYREGLCLDRSVFIPWPPMSVVDTVSTLLEGFDLVLLRLSHRLGHGSTKQITSIARHNRCLLVEHLLPTRPVDRDIPWAS